MKRHYDLLVGLILLTCGCDGDDYANEPLITIDPIVGVWEEVLDDSSQYDSIVWTFTADGLMTLNFDDNNLASGEWKDKAGCYAIQGIASKFVKRINGNYDNIVGLSLIDADKMLKGLK